MRPSQEKKAPPQPRICRSSKYSLETLASQDKIFRPRQDLTGLVCVIIYDNDERPNSNGVFVAVLRL